MTCSKWATGGNQTGSHCRGPTASVHGADALPTETSTPESPSEDKDAVSYRPSLVLFEDTVLQMNNYNFCDVMTSC